MLILNAFFMLSYITGNNSFPQPLNADEERECILRLKNGSAEEKEQARNTLVERNLRLVAHIAKKYGNTPIPGDDLISVGTIGLMKGIASFDSDKGTKLATYVARCIENEILMFMRSSKKHLQEVSLQEPIGVDKDGNEITPPLYTPPKTPIFSAISNSKLSCCQSFSFR